MSLFLMDCNGLGFSIRSRDKGQGEMRGSFPFGFPQGQDDDLFLGTAIVALWGSRNKQRRNAGILHSVQDDDFLAGTGRLIFGLGLRR